MAAYRITARSLERQLVGEHVLKEFASLEDLTKGAEALAGSPKAKVVLVLEEEESPHGGAPRRPQ